LFGVVADGKRWKARIHYGGKQHHLGLFGTKQEAALAYDKAAREHGEGERSLNYESIEAAEEAAAQAAPEHTKPRPPSGFHGVTAQQKRWKARIHYGDKRHHLGLFGTKQEAALAYDKAAREHGEGEKSLNYESIEAAEEAAEKARRAEGLDAKEAKKNLRKKKSPTGKMQARGIAQGAPLSANRHAPDASTGSSHSEESPFNTCLQGIRESLLEFANDPDNAEEPLTQFLQKTEGCPCVKGQTIFDEHNTFTILDVSRFIMIIIIILCVLDTDRELCCV
jgi:hypothetical protein